MSKAITYWWKKYQLLRDIKASYKKEVKNCECDLPLKLEYFNKFMECIK